MDRQLLRQKVRQIISGVFVVFKTKRELQCQNELFCNIISLIIEIIWRTFDVIIDDA